LIPTGNTKTNLRKSPIRAAIKKLRKQVRSQDFCIKLGGGFMRFGFKNKEIKEQIPNSEFQIQKNKFHQGYRDQKPGSRFQI
jgi:alanine racemase